MGKNDVEDALKRLDRLTQEEALMASAQLMETADNIANNVLDVDDRVAGVDDRVVCVGDQVAGVDDRVGGVDKRVAGVDERVAGVDERVAGVDDRVAGVDERVAGVGDGVDQVKRSWFPNRIHAGHAGSIILNRESTASGSS